MEFNTVMKSIIFNNLGYYGPIIRCGIVILLTPLLLMSVANASSPQDVRTIIQKWVETEKLVSEEEQAWQENEAAMQDLIMALEKEEQILKEKIETAKNLTFQADKERSELLKERNEYQLSSTSLSGKINDYERQVANLLRSLPPLLKQELADLSKNLIDNENASLSVRARTVVSIISQIEKFDNNITLTKDVREISPDKEVEVDILYIGLAEAFYVDRNTEFAGWGEITPEGWDWQENNEMATEVRQAVEIYESRIAPDLVELPLKIMGMGSK